MDRAPKIPRLRNYKVRYPLGFGTSAVGVSNEICNAPFDKAFNVSLTPQSGPSVIEDTPFQLSYLHSIRDNPVSATDTGNPDRYGVTWSLTSFQHTSQSLSSHDTRSIQTHH
jgi:hypothetical protein